TATAYCASPCANRRGSSDEFHRPGGITSTWPPMSGVTNSSLPSVGSTVRPRLFVARARDVTCGVETGKCGSLHTGFGGRRGHGGFVRVWLLQLTFLYTSTSGLAALPSPAKMPVELSSANDGIQRPEPSALSGCGDGSAPSADGVAAALTSPTA